MTNEDLQVVFNILQSITLDDLKENREALITLRDDHVAAANALYKLSFKVMQLKLKNAMAEGEAALGSIDKK